MEHRIRVEPDVGMMVPDKFVSAVWALKRIADGCGTIYDIAELMFAANQADADGDLVGVDEVERALMMAEMELDEARARGDSRVTYRLAEQAADMHTRWQEILKRKIPGPAR
jgi:hypothetical protein